MLAALTVDHGGVAVPSPDAFRLSFALGLGAAAAALAVALFIPQRRDPHEARPSLRS